MTDKVDLTNARRPLLFKWLPFHASSLLAILSNRGWNTVFGSLVTKRGGPEVFQWKVHQLPRGQRSSQLDLGLIEVDGGQLTLVQVTCQP
jgi:hypothetical protein